MSHFCLKPSNGSHLRVKSKDLTTVYKAAYGFQSQALESEGRFKPWLCHLLAKGPLASYLTFHVYFLICNKRFMSNIGNELRTVPAAQQHICFRFRSFHSPPPPGVSAGTRQQGSLPQSPRSWLREAVTKCSLNKTTAPQLLSNSSPAFFLFRALPSP